MKDIHTLVNDQTFKNSKISTYMTAKSKPILAHSVYTNRRTAIDSVAKRFVNTGNSDKYSLIKTG